MSQTTQLTSLALILAAHEGNTHFAISMRIFGKGDFFHGLLTKKRDCQTKTAERAFAWFDANWPEDLAWPDHIARPKAEPRTSGRDA